MKSAFSTNLPRQSSARRSPVMTLASPKEEVGAETEEIKLPAPTTPSRPIAETIGHGAWLDALGALEAQLSKAMARKNRAVPTVPRTAVDAATRRQRPPPLPQSAPAAHQDPHVTAISRAKLRVIEDLAEIELARVNGKTFLS